MDRNNIQEAYKNLKMAGYFFKTLSASSVHSTATRVSMLMRTQL